MIVKTMLSASLFSTLANVSCVLRVATKRGGRWLRSGNLGCLHYDSDSVFQLDDHRQHRPNTVQQSLSNCATLPTQPERDRAQAPPEAGLTKMKQPIPGVGNAASNLIQPNMPNMPNPIQPDPTQLESTKCRKDQR